MPRVSKRIVAGFDMDSSLAGQLILTSAPAGAGVLGNSPLAVVAAASGRVNVRIDLFMALRRQLAQGASFPPVSA